MTLENDPRYYVADAISAAKELTYYLEARFEEQNYDTILQLANSVHRYTFDAVNVAMQRLPREIL
jgi:DNA-binding phage protein